MRLDTFVWTAILDSSHLDIGSATALPDSTVTDDEFEYMTCCTLDTSGYSKIGLYNVLINCVSDSRGLRHCLFLECKTKTLNSRVRKRNAQLHGFSSACH